MSLGLCIQAGKELYKFLERQLGRVGLTPVQLQALAVLADGKARPMSELSGQLCCVGSNITAVVSRMVKAGWVKQQADVKDGRVRLVKIAPQGRKMLAAATEIAQCCPEAADLLTNKEWAELGRLLGKLLAGVGRLR